jgi:hypothetical protein
MKTETTDIKLLKGVTGNISIGFFYLRVSYTLTLTHNNTQSAKTDKLFYFMLNG